VTDADDTGASGAADGVAELAAIIGVPVEPLREAMRGPWNAGFVGPAFGHDVTVFTGLENPRVPGRPLVVLRVDHDARVIDVGRAVGVPLPDGRPQYSLGEPRASIDYDQVPLDEVWGPEHSAGLLIDELGLAVSAVLDAAVLRGTRW
jgi:hypothetical protein